MGRYSIQLWATEDKRLNGYQPCPNPNTINGIEVRINNELPVNEFKIHTEA